jgi:hypothetical protein
MWLIAALLSIAVGLIVGLLGGGGSILTVPMLVYVLKVEAEQAVATSLLLVFATSAVGVAAHAGAGSVRWPAGLAFGLSGMAGAAAGGQLARWVPGFWLLLLFALVMLATAAGMLLRREQAAPPVPPPLRIGRVLPIGVGVGLVSGLVGAGGGFLIVPALTLLAGLTMREAIGTSLLVLALQSGAGFVSHLSHTPIEWRLALLVTSTATAGSLLGARLSRRIHPARLRRGFAVLVLAMGVFMLGKQLMALRLQQKIAPLPAQPAPSAAAAR